MLHISDEKYLVNCYGDLVEVRGFLFHNLADRGVISQ